MKPIALAVNGACGHMGRRLVQVAAADPEFRIVAACDVPGHAHEGEDVGHLCGLAELKVRIAPALPFEPRPDVVIDFSSPRGTMWLLGACTTRQIPLVIGTMGHSDAELDEIRAAAHQTAILKAQNLSLGMNVLAELVHRAAALMRGQPVDVEIVERHHRGKKEAPGLGTLRLAEIVEQQMGHYTRRHGRSGSQSERPPQELGIHSLRAGDAAGEHLVLLAGLGETLELKHTVSSRDAFVRGALQAARFLVAQAPGWYEMSDVLGL